MKKLKHAALVLFLSAFAVSCSSDDSNPVNNNPSGEEFFEYTIDGEEQNVTTWIAARSESSFEVQGTAASGRVIHFTFNQWGNLGDASTMANDLEIPWRTSYHYFKSNYFTFELVAIDEANKTVEVNFSGKVFDEEYDITSTFSTVEGSFKVAYTQVTPQISGLGVSATVNGTAWHDSDGDQEGGFFSGENLTLNASNDSKYTLGIVTNHDNTTTGVHTFGEAESSNKVKLFVYDTQENYEVEYTTTTGTMNVTEKTVGAQYTVIAGTFSFTAEHPETGAAITVQNGTFKQVYLNY